MKKPAERFLAWLTLHLFKENSGSGMHCHHSNTSLSGLFDQNFSQFFVREQINWNYRIKLASISQKDGYLMSRNLKDFVAEEGKNHTIHWKVQTTRGL